MSGHSALRADPVDLAAFARIRDLEDDAPRVGAKRPMSLAGRAARVVSNCEPAIERCIVEASLEYENLLRVIVNLRAERSCVRTRKETREPAVVSRSAING